jgi:hypothetical protein
LTAVLEYQKEYDKPFEVNLDEYFRLYPQDNFVAVEDDEDDIFYLLDNACTDETVYKKLMDHFDSDYLDLEAKDGRDQNILTHFLITVDANFRTECVRNIIKKIMQIFSDAEEVYINYYTEKNVDENYAYMVAAGNPYIDSDIFKEILNTTLIYFEDAPDTIRYLINIHNTNDDTALSMCIKSYLEEDSEIQPDLRKDMFEKMQVLVRKGANPDETASISEPPFYWALSTLDVSLIRLFIKHGANVNGTSSNPLLYLYWSLVSIK